MDPSFLRTYDGFCMWYRQNLLIKWKSSNCNSFIDALKKQQSSGVTCLRTHQKGHVTIGSQWGWTTITTITTTTTTTTRRRKRRRRRRKKRRRRKHFLSTHDPHPSSLKRNAAFACSWWLCASGCKRICFLKCLSSKARSTCHRFSQLKRLTHAKHSARSPYLTDYKSGLGRVGASTYWGMDLESKMAIGNSS